ncbi:unnamed protein product [Lymnaea stagnalis]|uniref:Ig-like domain-containing protein n=1 Tax=Lymnaea stagnalis TaxID=6523 RepID=A0AAV2HPV8_LYMST
MGRFNISRIGKLFAAIMMGGLISRMNSLEITDRLDYVSNGGIGTTATFRCDWFSGNSDFRLNLSVVARSKKLFIYYLPEQVFVTGGPDLHPRLFFTYTFTSLTMAIVDISCSDIDTYICRMNYSSYNVAMNKNSTGRLLDIKIPPQVPVMTQPPSLEVLEGSSISYKCLANLGRPNKGKIVWNAYVNGQKVELSFTPVLKETSNDNSCTFTVESTVTIQVNRTKQNITLACFSTNKDFQEIAPPFCDNPGTDLCAQSQPLNILYASSQMIVNRIPQSDVEEGSTMTLTCQAEGNPQPNYTWRQVGNANRLLNGVQEGLTNKLILNNLSATKDSGIYSCTATNNVRDVNNSIASQVSVNVFPRSTTITTATTAKSTTTIATTATTTTTPKISTTFSSSQATGQETADSPVETNSTAIAVGVPIGLGLTAFIICVTIVIIRRNERIKKEETSKTRSNTINSQEYNNIGATPYINTEFHAYETANITPWCINEVTPASTSQRVDEPNVSIQNAENEVHLYDDVL